MVDELALPFPSLEECQERIRLWMEGGNLHVGLSLQLPPSLSYSFRRHITDWLGGTSREVDSDRGVVEPRSGHSHNHPRSEGSLYGP